MDSVVSGLILFIAIQHVLFMLLEMVFWTRPIGLKIFRMTSEQALATQKLAANQGLYNGFLAAGCFWAFFTNDFNAQIFFLSCVFFAGVFAAMSVNRRIFWIQGFPAMLALLLIFQTF